MPAPDALPPSSLPEHQFPIHGDSVLLVIPTENKRKVQILSDGITKQAPPGIEVHIVTIPVESSVGEQPYNGAGMEGARNQINNALNRLHGIEFSDVFKKNNIRTVLVASYRELHPNQRPRQASRFGIVAIHNANTGETCVGCSRGVTIAQGFVDAALTFGTDGGNRDYGKKTVGSILASKVLGLDGANWHEVVAGVSRYDLLREVVGNLRAPW